MTDVVRVSYEILCAAVKTALCEVGVPEHQASLEASIMVEADLLEVPSQGVRCCRVY